MGYYSDQMDMLKGGLHKEAGFGEVMGQVKTAATGAKDWATKGWIDPKISHPTSIAQRPAGQGTTRQDYGNMSKPMPWVPSRQAMKAIGTDTNAVTAGGDPAAVENHIVNGDPRRLDYRKREVQNAGRFFNNQFNNTPNQTGATPSNAYYRNSGIVPTAAMKTADLANNMGLPVASGSQGVQAAVNAGIDKNPMSKYTGLIKPAMIGLGALGIGAGLYGMHKMFNGGQQAQAAPQQPIAYGGNYAGYMPGYTPSFDPRLLRGARTPQYYSPNEQRMVQ